MKMNPSASIHRFSDLLALIQRLRGDNGCPWDRKQTPESMAPHLTEEAYELADAISTGSPRAVREELGDVLFQLVFIADLYREAGHFEIADVISDAVDKMTRRHPHVFGDAAAATPEDVKIQWHRIKGEEKKAGPADARLASVPVGLPALMRAYRISDRVERTGIARRTGDDRLAAMEEKWTALKSALSRPGGEGEREGVSAAFGETFLALVQLAMGAGVHPESALAEAVRRFQCRFEAVERAAAEAGIALEDLPPGEKKRLWNAAGGDGDGKS
jgi:MazG family protein